MNFSVNNSHLLEGDPAPRRDYSSQKNKVKFENDRAEAIIIHYTAARSAESAASFLATTPKASAHIVIGRDGTVYQLVPLNIIAWHAGISSYGGKNNWNNFSIGIELDNAGPLTKTGNEFTSWFGGKYPANEVMQGVHRNENASRYWHTFTQIQIETCEEVCKAIIEKYKIDQVLGHEEISVGRKIDPGPAFPLDRFREQLLSHDRLSDEAEVLRPAPAEVTADKLNIRADASVQAKMVASPLTTGTKVTIIDETLGWYKVRTEIEGWVNKAYVRKT
jgi:N-acetylmuramoyl-L-alanine amidase